MMLQKLIKIIIPGIVIGATLGVAIDSYQVGISIGLIIIWITMIFSDKIKKDA